MFTASYVKSTRSMLRIFEGMPVSLPILHSHAPSLPAERLPAEGSASSQSTQPQPLAFADAFAGRMHRVRQATSPALPAANVPHSAIKVYLAESLMRAANGVKALDLPKIAVVANAPGNQIMVGMALVGCANHCSALMEAMDAVLNQGHGLIDSPPLKARLESTAASIATLIDAVDQIDKATPASETPFKFAIGATVALVGFFSMYYLWSAQQNFSTISGGSGDASTAYNYNDAAKNLASGLGYGIVTVAAGCLLRYDRLHAPGGTRKLAALLSDLSKAKIALDLVRQNLGNADFLDQVASTHRRLLRDNTPQPLESLSDEVARERASALANEVV